MICKTCLINKPELDFHLRGGRRRPACKICVRAAERVRHGAWYKKNPSKQRKYNRVWESKGLNMSIATSARATWRRKNPIKHKEYQLKNKYNLTISDRDALLEKQGNRCAICKTAEPGNRGWCIDHIKDTKFVRGILCNLCNTGIGSLKHDPSAMRTAADYVETANNSFRLSGK